MLSHTVMAKAEGSLWGLTATATLTISNRTCEAVTQGERNEVRKARLPITSNITELCTVESLESQWSGTCWSGGRVVQDCTKQHGIVGMRNTSNCWAINTRVQACVHVRTRACTREYVHIDAGKLGPSPAPLPPSAPSYCTAYRCVMNQSISAWNCARSVARGLKHERSAADVIKTASTATRAVMEADKVNEGEKVNAIDDVITSTLCCCCDNRVYSMVMRSLYSRQVRRCCTSQPSPLGCNGCE